MTRNGHSRASPALDVSPAYSIREPPLYDGFVLREEEEIKPQHLRPFLPYMEKSMDPNTSPPEWSKKDFRPVETAKNWLKTCNTQHCGRGSGCLIESHALDDPWSRPLLVIDVVENCIVNTPPTSRYVALSYTWEKSDGTTVCTTTKNLAGFKKPGGLIAAREVIPATVRETIDFVRQIGERYLWVDRFCIVQDETTAKQSQLNAMGKIYAGSYLTIVAAQSDDASGPLYNPCPSARAESHPDPLPMMTGRKILLDQTNGLMHTNWYSRAWTFQEYLFSKRKIVFQNDTVNWECAISAWHETQKVSLDTIPELMSRHNYIRTVSKSHINGDLAGFKFPPWPDVSRYARLVALFNQRNLTFPEDAVDAFAGVLSPLSRIFSGGFISGIPVLCFDAALLWQPHRRLLRRISARKSASEAILPSWSWVGWEGVLNSESWRSAGNYIFEGDQTYSSLQCSWKTTSTVQWTYSLTLKSPRKPIKPSAQYLDHTIDPDALTENTAWSWAQEVGENYTFRHSDFPLQPFRYPVPIRDQNVAHTPPISARYLHCTTVRASLHPSVVFNHEASSACLNMFLLTRDTYAFAGVLRFNGNHKEARQLKEIELVEISAGSVYPQDIEEQSFEEWNLSSFQDANLYEFVNVLWVEWVEGVAYRKALGRVKKEVWENLEKETIELTLG